MKLNMKSLLLGVVIAVGAGFTSCSDDDFTPTIFDTDPKIDYLDKTSYTFPLDTFTKVNFLEPYNLKYVYKFDDKGSDKNKNLTPADYDKSVDLAVLVKYIWFDVYENVGGKEFLKAYCPRIINLTGSKNYNNGTEVAGDASSGVKINLYNVNNLDPNNLSLMNEYFFTTMHHEFGHILDQQILHPTKFNTLSSGHYDASGWQDAADSVRAGDGFITPYASSAQSEDWAESMAQYIVLDSIAWNIKLNSASYEWEELDCDSKTEYNKLLSAGCNLDTIGYFKSTKSGLNQKLYRRKCLRNADGTVALGEDGKPQWIHESGVDGREVILEKIDLVRTYLKENYNVDLDAIRNMVQDRTYVKNPDGSWDINRYGQLVNKLTYPRQDGTTLMDELREWVNKYKSLQQ